MSLPISTGMLSGARVALCKMHRQLTSARQHVTIPRCSIAAVAKFNAMPARPFCSKGAAVHEPMRSQTPQQGHQLHAQSIGTEDSPLLDSFNQSQPLTVLEARQQMRDAVAPEAHRIAGVTFEGRQESIQKLQAGAPSHEGKGLWPHLAVGGVPC